jgi:hypothetical protein
LVLSWQTGPFVGDAGREFDKHRLLLFMLLHNPPACVQPDTAHRSSCHPRENSRFLNRTGVTRRAAWFRSSSVQGEMPIIAPRSIPLPWLKFNYTALENYSLPDTPA